MSKSYQQIFLYLLVLKSRAIKVNSIQPQTTGNREKQGRTRDKQKLGQ